MAPAPRDLLRAMFDAAVEAALPGRVVPTHLPEPPRGRTVIVGAGKASAAMAKAVEDAWPGPLEGLVVTRYGHAVSCLEHLDRATEETPKPGDPRLARAEAVMIATPWTSLQAAAAIARAAGAVPLVLGDAIEGEARDVGRVMAGLARSAAQHGEPVAAPGVLISGGETTVTVRGDGRGGRNVEFLLSLAVALGGTPGVWAIAGDTDGVDGAEEVAGAIVTPDTLARAAALGISARDSLERNDGHGFFAALGDQVVTGPTLTNVNDFRAILVAEHLGGATAQAAE